MAARRRRKGSKGESLRGSLRLGVVFALLVGINVYVFFFSPRSLKKVKQDLPVPGAAASEFQETQIVEPGLAEADATGTAANAEPVAPTPPPAGREVAGTVRDGESLGSILRREGLTPPESDEVIRALAPVMNFKKEIRAGQRYVLRYDDQGALLGFELRASPITVYEVVRTPDGKLVGRKVAGARTEVRVHEVSGTVTSSLYSAIKERGEETELVAEMVDLFAYDINFFIDTHDGDRFKIIVEKQFIDGAFWRYGKVLAAEYSGKVGTYRAFWWQPPGGKGGGYYDEKGQNIEKSMLKTPLKFTRVSSQFNPRRMHPVLHTVRGHFGTDYAAPTGTPVWASAAGKVVHVGPGGGAGNLVILDHGGGLQTLYMHLSRFAKGLRLGQRVNQKQIIGYVGSTGLATGPHLHFSVKQNGRYVDPQKLRPVRAASIGGSDREAFLRDIADRRDRLERLTVANAPTGATTQ